MIFSENIWLIKKALNFHKTQKFSKTIHQTHKRFFKKHKNIREIMKILVFHSQQIVTKQQMIKFSIVKMLKFSMFVFTFHSYSVGFVHCNALLCSLPAKTILLLRGTTRP